MKRRHLFCSVLFFLLISTIASSCKSAAAGQAPAESASLSSKAASQLSPTSQAGSSTEAAESKPQTSSVSSGTNSKLQPSLADVVNSLKKDKTVQQYEISHSGEKIALIKAAKDDKDSFDFFIMTVSGQSAKISGASGRLYDPKWSWDDRYVSVNDGTSVLRNTSVIDSSSLKVKTQIANTEMVWAPSSENAAFSVVSKIKPSVDMELNGTLDIRIWDMNTLQSRTVLKADADTLYRPLKWDRSGLSVSKSSLKTSRDTTVLLPIFQ